MGGPREGVTEREGERERDTVTERDAVTVGVREAVGEIESKYCEEDTVRENTRGVRLLKGLLERDTVV